MTTSMREKLTKYLNDHQATILDTANTKCCEMKYKPNCSNKAFTIAVAFVRELHSTDPLEYIVGDYGYALVLPGYWLSIPTDLSLPYIEYYIDNYMKENIFGNSNNSAGSNNAGGNNAGCGCPAAGNKPPVNITPCPVQKPVQANLHDDPNGQLSGYFIPGQ